ncbi:MAG: hypothetical protein GY841_15985 [FCB group bacterium]|nr:hypothetical protein [FCB group bacterium]
MIKLPKRVKIGGGWVEVEYPYTFRERTDVLGLSQSTMRRINVGNIMDGGEEIPGYAVMTTFIHELLHAIDHQTGHRMFDDEEDTSAIHGLSCGILNVLLDNGWLPKEFIGEDDE